MFEEPPGMPGAATDSGPVQNGLWSSWKDAGSAVEREEGSVLSHPESEGWKRGSVDTECLARGENGQGLEKKLPRLPSGEVNALLIEPKSPVAFFGVVGAFFLLNLRRRGEFM